MAKLARLLIAVFASALALAPAMAWASPPVMAHSAGVVNSHTQTLVRTADGNSFFTAVDHVTITGADFSGQVVDTYTFIVHPNGLITGQGAETCDPSCTIGGRTGNYTEVFSFTATPGFATFEGHFTILSGTGGLADLHGEGTFQGSGTSTGFTEAVDLSYHFEP